MKEVTSISNNTEPTKQQKETTDEEIERPKNSYDFDDESTWSDNSLNDDAEDTSIFSAGECNDETLRDASGSESPPPHVSSETVVPPKRIISKRKDRSISQVHKLCSVANTVEILSPAVSTP